MSEAKSGLSRFLPGLRSHWWTVLLGLSLMANLLIGGLMLGQRYRHGAGDRLAVSAAAQLIPRKFFFDLPGERRQELLKIVRDNMKELRGLRDGSAESVMQLATALEAEPFDADAVRTAVESYSIGKESLAVRSSTIVRDLIARLTPDERKSLASAIRERGAGRKPMR